MAERSDRKEGDGSRDRGSVKRRRIALQGDIESPLHAGRRGSKPMEIELDDNVEEFHVPKWTGEAFEGSQERHGGSVDDGGPEGRGAEGDGEVVNLVASDDLTKESGVSNGGPAEQPGTPKLQFDTSKPLKPELVLAASVLPPAVPNSVYRARVRTSVVKAVKAPLVDIIGDECTDMRKVEVALKRFVDKKGLWWDWNYGKKSKRETGGGYVRVDLDPQLRQICMCTLASLKEVLFHARRYIEIDETQTIEVDDEDGVEESGSAVVVEEPIPLKIEGVGSGGQGALVERNGEEGIWIGEPDIF
ncbi:hypothetical protein Pmar_PMAR015354 [Perkinsus marinus ATCC 50983]|uniref:Uncharacterized protein n=1 Tax=Perkinsus marinus (strain ATCC 50983 / TXsc) TaxID=423536 RepID=C5LU58_PERM5|nr:hypothetical protein Pmar_PMAR015354 [Perkinsus marinus ATCC 50983]EEQ99732.1 hypothetical protein Pmar_PMAR015354 [Perkinsus marinus ATCC 50983]|eukprot:XP_002767015.1 hypothetical protein Pmar_PMAR015354 [Perkinsus marinus ATCC 50983]